MTYKVNNSCYIALELPDKESYYVVAELREEYNEHNTVSYVVEANKYTIPKLEEYGVQIKNNNFIPGFDFDYGYTQRHVRLPFFITMRTIDRRRPDVDIWLERFGMKYFDQFEMLIRNKGWSLDNWRVLRNLDDHNVVNKETYLNTKGETK